MHWSAASSLPAIATVAAAAGCVESVPTAVSSASSMGERFGRGGVRAPRRGMRASRRSHPLLRLGMVVVSRCACATAEARSWEQQLRKTIKAAACVRHSRFSRLGGEKTAGPARGRPVQNVPVRGARRQGRPAHRAAPPARGCRGRQQQRHVAEGANRGNGPAAAPLPRAPAGLWALSTGGVPVAARSLSTARRSQQCRRKASNAEPAACNPRTPARVTPAVIDAPRARLGLLALDLGPPAGGARVRDGGALALGDAGRRRKGGRRKGRRDHGRPQR